MSNDTVGGLSNDTVGGPGEAWVYAPCDRTRDAGEGSAVENEEAGEAPEGYDHATSARIEQAVDCGECGERIPAGEWLWLLSQGEVEEAEEVKVVCANCGEAMGCGDIQAPEVNGA